MFIWDEAPMAPRYALEIIDRTLKYIMSNDLLFGAKIVILGRDFRQLLPTSIPRRGFARAIIKPNSDSWIIGILKANRH